MLDGLEDGHGLDCGAGAEQVAGHRLGGVEQQSAGVVSEGVLDGDALSEVTLRGGGAVHVDVVHLFGADVAVLHGEAHGGGGAVAVGCGCGDVVGVCCHADTAELAVDAGAAGQGVIQTLQNERRHGHGQKAARHAYSHHCAWRARASH